MDTTLLKPATPATIHLESFKVVGISIQTTNQNGKASVDLGNLWQRFYSENISSRINNKVNEDVYSVYTDYERDHTGYYKVIIGHKVSSIDDQMEGLTGVEIVGAHYLLFTASGEIPAAVVRTWQEIWNKDKELNRSYSADFEVYGEKSQDPKNAEVDIFIGIDEKP
jgi:predicted transcriptional regulator YdeE